jgi:hypothetical protein
MIDFGRYLLASSPVGPIAPPAPATGNHESSDRLMAIELPLGMEGGGRGGLAAFVAATGQNLLTTNASAHHAHSSFPFSQSAKPPPASMMLVPVFLQGWDGATGTARVTMVMEVGDKADGGSYNHDDLVLLSCLGRSVSSVLEHIESNERSVSQATHLLSSSGTRLYPARAHCAVTCQQLARPWSHRRVSASLPLLSGNAVRAIWCKKRNN